MGTLRLSDFLVVPDNNQVSGGKTVETDVFFGSIFDIASSRGGIEWPCLCPLGPLG